MGHCSFVTVQNCIKEKIESRYPFRGLELAGITDYRKLVTP